MRQLSLALLLVIVVGPSAGSPAQARPFQRRTCPPHEHRGDLAYFIGRYAESLQPQTGALVRSGRRLILVWNRQQDRSWEIARNVCTDLPST